MRKLLIAIMTLCASYTFAQDCDLPISVAFSTDAEQIPVAAQRAITNRLKQVLTQNGVSGNLGFEQFAIVPKFDVIDKHIVAGPPVKIVYNLNLNLEIVDTQEGTVFSTCSMEINTVGENETKAFMAASQQIGTQSQQIKNFISRARTKIVSYYDKNWQRIVSRAQTLSGMNRKAEALYHIMSIPECCSGYSSAMKQALNIYKSYTDYEGERLLMRARALWASGNNDEAAAEAAQLLTQIEPTSKAYAQAKTLLNEIKAKSSKNEPWNYELKVYNDSVDIQKQQIEAAKAVGVAYGRGQKQQTTNLMFVR